MILGIDYSSHQQSVNFGAVADAGYAFATGKVTGGSQYTNPYFGAQFTAAGKAGLVRGIYHYDAEPTVATGTATEEAAHFLRNLPVPLPDWTHLALDAEERATRDVARYLTWLRTVRDATKTTPLFYTYPAFINEASDLPWGDLAEFPLWYAWYPNDIGNIAQLQLPSAPAGWPRVTIWQYSGGAPVPGTSFPTDLNRFDGTIDELRALGKPGAVTTDTQPPANDNPGFPAALQPDGRTVLNGVDFGGTAVTVEEVAVQVRNAAGERYTRRWVGYALDAWQRLDAPAPQPAPDPTPAPAPAPAPDPQPAPIVGGTVDYHDHGPIPLSKPDPKGSAVVDTGSANAYSVYADVQSDHAFVVWSQSKGQYLPKQPYGDALRGRWLLAWQAVVHEDRLKVLVTTSAAGNASQDVRSGFLDFGPVAAL